MGLFDSILKKGMRAVSDALGDAVADAVAEKVADGLGLNKESDGRADTQGSEKQWNRAASQSIEDRSFDEKLKSVLGSLGVFEIRTNVPVEELEQEAGTQLYTRGGCYAKPDAMSYVLYEGGERALVINLWWEYKYYNHYANREIAQYCKNSGIKVLDFFDYLPNEIDYMEERIRKALA